MKHYDVIIVGAGLIGSALALLLAKDSNLKIAVFERSPQLEYNLHPNQRVVALGSVATGVLDDIGILSKFGREFCHSYERMFVWDENSEGELAFCAAEQQLERLGFMIDSVQCTLLLQQLMVATPQITCHFQSDLQRLQLGADGATLSTIGGACHAPLIVAADGANSWLRGQAKIFANHHDYQQQGIVARIQTSDSHQDTAWQRFLSSGPLAILPLADNQSSIVWSADNERAAAMMSLDDEQFCESLQSALGQKLGDVTLRSKRVAFPLQSQKADTYFKRHVALVGDAAHSIHPLAGQGANLGFKDIKSLSSLLVTSEKSALGSLTLLQKYQRSRKGDNEQTDLMMSLLHTLYQSNMPLWLTARGLGMSWLNASERIKRLLIKQAMGL